MVRTRYKHYTGDVQQDHGQAAQSHAADHVGKRSSGTFHRFQDLPCELRLMVWKAALAPRLVAVIPRPCPKDHGQASNLEINLIRGIPALLAVNHESRHLALRHYTWRFTVDLVISPDGSRRMMVPKRQRARVVMSPDDTLGLFRCQPNWFVNVFISSFRVKVANEKRSPWRIHPTTDAPRGQHWFRKVAVLGDALESNLYIVRALNTTPWDLDSILHGRSAVTRTARSPHTKHKMLIASAEMAQWRQGSPARQSIEEAILDRLELEDPQKQEIDMWAFVLAGGEKDEDWECFLERLSRLATQPNVRPAVRRPPRFMQVSR